jgi:sugar lactone lactonase YvrE
MKSLRGVRILALAWVASVLVGCGGGGGGSSTPVVTPPTITAQPSNVTVADGQQASFAVTATGTAPLSYQWLKNGQQIANAQSATYTIAAVQYGESGTAYSVVVYDPAGPVTSNSATLTVTAVAPAITTAPKSQTTIVGGSAAFSVVASGTTPLNYQWNKNGVAIPGAVNSSYFYDGAQLADNGAQITVTVSNVSGSVTTTAVTLTVQGQPPSIVTQPAQQTVLAGSKATFVVVASGSPPLSFQWYVNGAAITGATSASYVTPVTSTANSGELFDVVVSNASGGITSSTALLTVDVMSVPPTITAQPQNVTAAVGGSATFSIMASGTQPLTYQWQVGGASIPGATNSSYTLSPVSAQNNQDSYTAVVTNSAGSVTSQAAVLTVTIPAGRIDLVAGQLGGQGNIDGTGSAARFFSPESVAIDAAGNVYVADTYNSTIREISPDGVVTTIAGAPDKGGSLDGTSTNALFNYPQGITIDSAGNIYVADTSNQTIRKISSSGVVTTFAGTVGVAGFANGNGTAAQFAYPQGLTTDAAGNVYVADSGNNVIRMITPAGVVTTLAGTGSAGATNGMAAAAQFNHPDAVAIDASGDVFVADTNNSVIREISAAGMVTTLAGSAGNAGWANGTGVAAQFDHPQSVAIDISGNLFVTDTFDGTIREVTPAGVVTTLAGKPYVTGFTDGTGAAALFSSPWSIVVDAADNLYVADFGNDTIRKIAPAAAVTTFAGTAPHPGSVDGTQSAAQFNGPYAAATDPSGNMYIADTANNTIRKITPAGVSSTLAGTAGVTGSNDGTGGAAQFNSPQGIFFGASGSLYVTDTGNDTIRQITTAGVVTTLAGTAGTKGSTNGTGSAALFSSPQGVVTDTSGNVYVADTGNDTIRKIASGGVVTTLAGTAGVTGSTDAVGTAAQFDAPTGLAVDTSGNVYVADSGNYTIREVSPAGQVTTIAGVAGQPGNADGTGTDARFNAPTGIAIDSGSNLYVVDSFYRIIREVTPAAVVTTVAGFRGEHGVALGALPGSFNNPIGIAILPGSGISLVLPDKAENAILQVTLP